MEKHHKFFIRYVVLEVWVVLVLHNYLAVYLAVERSVWKGLGNTVTPQLN